MKADSGTCVLGGITAHAEIADDPDNDKYVIVSLWYSPRVDGDSVPAFTAHVRGAEVAT